jgi:hypothetical protein
MRNGVGTRQQLFEEKSLLARFAEAAGSGDDLKAAYENEIGHATSDSTIYNLPHLHGWRKLMPRPFQFGPGSGGGTAEPAVNVKSNDS